MAGQLYCGKCNDTDNNKLLNKTTYTCGKWGHKKTDCKYNSNTDNKQAKQAQEMVLMATDKTTYAKDIEYHNNIWIGNSGATTHMVNLDKHLMNCTTIHEKITIGDGKDIIATKKGTLPGAVKQLDGSIKQVYIELNTHRNYGAIFYQSQKSSRTDGTSEIKAW